ncbi:hypothetical protein M426DRAFT_110751 [Hypoxylon sp. CI-4A]|nr:hypothetical protein M426DRAFT_110751 [Hypoxylon sp. CI-4A]
MNRTLEDTDIGPVALGAKRPWETTGQWLEFITNRDTTTPSPYKKARVLSSTNFQPSGCDQQAWAVNLNTSTPPYPSNYHAVTHNSGIMGLNHQGGSLDSDHLQVDSEAQASSSPAMLLPTFQDTMEEGSVVSDGDSEELPYDTCFGMIAIENFQLRDGFFQKQTTNQISLDVNGNMVVIRAADSKAYGGLLDRKAAHAIVALRKNHDVEISASFMSTSSIKLLIYGRLEQSEAIGEELLKHDCFLQQPDSYDASRSYYNPQCFTIPDEDELLSRDNEVSLVQSTALDEKEKSKVAELLDSAAGPIDFRRAQASDILTTTLKAHQAKALAMMLEKESGNIRDAQFPSVWVENPDAESSHFKFYNTITQSYTSQSPRLCSGGLLADEMGLGKTLSTLALIATSLNHRSRSSRTAHATLIVCPLTTIPGWQDQIERHLIEGSLSYKVYHGSTRDSDLATLTSSDIVLTTYETLRAELPDGQIANAGTKRSGRAGLLHNIDWQRVVLDEAHIIRNRTTKIFQAVSTLNAQHRWCLTGTPIQNRLDDLGALVDFLKVDPFNNPNVFKNTFLTPIGNGEKLGWERLRSLIKAIALRRTKQALAGEVDLPPRHEIIHWVNLNDEEKALYDLVKRYFTLAIDAKASNRNAFQLITRLRQICNHGSDLLPSNLRAWLSNASLFNDNPLPPAQMCEVCDAALDDDPSSSHMFSCFHQVCQACIPTDYVLASESCAVCPVCNPTIPTTADRMDRVSDIAFGTKSTSYRPSSKVIALLQNLQNDRQAAFISGQPSSKSVIFSVWTSMLDLVGTALSMNAFVYQRLDGSQTLAQRRYALENFRHNADCTILLASLGSAAVGLDLTMATRVHLMEPGWNPLLEQQAIDRVHRLGQESEVLATRYIVSGLDSVEQYIQHRQEQKINMVTSSLDKLKDHSYKVNTILEDFKHTICI